MWRDIVSGSFFVRHLSFSPDPFSCAILFGRSASKMRQKGRIFIVAIIVIGLIAYLLFSSLSFSYNLFSGYRRVNSSSRMLAA